MKTLLTIAILLCACPAFAEKGEIVKTDVCDDHVIVETDSGGFSVLEDYTLLVYEGQRIIGALNDYGLHTFYDSDGDELGDAYVDEIMESSLEDAISEACD